MHLASWIVFFFYLSYETTNPLCYPISNVFFVCLKKVLFRFQISWCPDISTRNAFEPLTLVLQSPQHSPPGDIFTTAMEARRKRSLPNHSHGDNSLSVKNSSQNSNPVRKISQASSNPVRKNSQGSAVGRKNSPDRLSTGRSHFSHVGDSDRSISNSSSAAGTPKKASGFKKYVKKFF